MLTGRFIIIPKSIIEPLKGYLSDNFIEFSEDEFKEFEAYPYYFFISGSPTIISNIVVGCTQCLIQGNLNIIIGTGSLLGEGWDCPSINSLILASQIGSFVATNQMRGRAIRVDDADNNKVSNIWHLATFEPTLIGGGHDFDILKRRFDTFLGISETEDIITDGFKRINLPLFDDEFNPLANQEVLDRALNRENVSKKWFRALGSNRTQSVNFCAKSDGLNRRLYLTLSNLVFSKGWVSKIINPVKFLSDIPRMKLDDFLIKRFCVLVIKALYENNIISTNPFRIKIKPKKGYGVIVSCKNRKDSIIIQKSLSEVFKINSNARYVLAIKRPMIKPIYVVVPSIFSITSFANPSTRTFLDFSTDNPLD